VEHGPSSPGCRRSLDARIEEDLDGFAEAVEVREAIDRLQTISIEVSEELDAYQQRYAPWRLPALSGALLSGGASELELALG